VKQLRDFSWWTDEDQAALDVALTELTGAIVEHRARCEICSAPGYNQCQGIGDAIELVVDYRNRLAGQAMAREFRAVSVDRILER
jgi:hypothetical protein